MWRGYTGCVDVDVLGDDKPVLNTSRHMYGYRTDPRSYQMLRYDHTQYDFGTWGITGLNPASRNDARRGCWVVPPQGQLTADGMSHDDALDGVKRMCLNPPRRRQGCHATVCVPLAPPPNVIFGRLSDRNIPMHGVTDLDGGHDLTNTQCQPDVLDPANQPNGSQVCYNVMYDFRALSHDGRVGDPWTTSDDPRDDVFYSTMFLKREDIRFDSPDCGADCGVV